MAAALLDRMDEAGQDGLVAKDLVDWYMASFNYNPGTGTGTGSGGKSTTGSEGKEKAAADNDADARAAAAAAEMIPKLLSVIRRMIKRDKSIVAVKSTVKGSKRIEDMLLRIRSQAEAAADNDDELNVSTVAAAGTVVATAGTLIASPATAAKLAVIADSLVSTSKDNLDEQHLPVPVVSGAVEVEAEAEADQVAKLRKQIEEKKASLLAKAKADADVRESEQGEAAATAKAAEDLPKPIEPIEISNTSLQQDQDEEERTRQEVEAAAVANQQAAIAEMLREEEERRLDLLAKQAHREAMQMAEQRFIAAEAEKKRQQQEAADNERKTRTAIEVAERQERERLHEAEVVAAAAEVKAEASVASPAVTKVADEQQLPVPVVSGKEAEADQVAKLRRQIEEKKALLLAKAKANVRETEQGDTATAKAVDNAANAKVKPNIAASEYTGNA